MGEYDSFHFVQSSRLTRGQGVSEGTLKGASWTLHEVIAQNNNHVSTSETKLFESNNFNAHCRKERWRAREGKEDQK